MKTFQSTPITFIDQTDSRKLEVYITSNMPTVQIFNGNSGAYTPDWREGEKLVLSMDVFLDSRTMTVAEYNSTAIKWYKNDVEMTDGSIEDISDDKRKITIKDNILKDDAIITYTCEATYQGIVASSRITFTRVDSGLNGNDGADGTSVRILGTADSVALVPDTNYYTVVYSKGSIIAAEVGDSYIYGGDLYVCSVVDGEGTNDYFVNVGPIQGPKGEDAKSIVLSGNSQTFKVSKTNIITPSVITVVAQTSNTSITSWSYSTNGGQTFLSTIPSGVIRDGNIVTITGSTLSTNSLVIKASNGTIEDVFTIYKTFDGTDGKPGDPGSPAPLAFLTNENVSFVANENGQVALTTFTTSVVAYKGVTKETPIIATNADGTLAISGLPSGMTVTAPVATLNEIILTFSIANNSTLGSATSNSGTITIPITSPVSTNLKLNWSKINTGRTGVSIESTTVSYGMSDSSTVQPTSWQSTIPTVADGKYLWTRTIIDYTDESKPDTVTYTYAKQGTKGDTGNAGNSVTVSSIQYQEGTSATTAPTGTWSNAVVAVADGRYLWTKTTFSDGKVAYGVAKQGNAGRGVSKITENYLASTAASGVTTATSGWTTTIQTIDASKRYLWNYETITYTDNTTSNTNPVVIGVFGATGNTGKGIASITEYYLATASASGVTISTTGWTPTIQTISATNKYLWNYELITYTDNTTSTVAPVIIGVYGDKGDSGTPASLVDITPSAMYFKSTTGSTGTFTPEYIYLYPRFQNATYSNWQYSRDGGATWTAASGANGLAIGTYNSVANSLRIARGSTLYTDSITSISFRCNSTATGIYDTVSIAKIYDVVDLQIGGRNLLTDTSSEYRNLNVTQNAGTITYILYSDLFNKGLQVGDFVTFSVFLKTNSGKKLKARLEHFNSNSDRVTKSSDHYIENGEGLAFITVQLLEGYARLNIQIDANLTASTHTTTTTEQYKLAKLEKSNTPSDWSPAPEDLIEEAANVNVMLSNEAHFFEATAGGVPIDTSVTLDVVGYKGSVKSATTVGTISGIPSAGMTATVTNNGTTNTKLTIAVTSALTSDIADYGILTIPITVNGHTINKIFNWTKAKAGDVGRPGDDAVTFQVYSNNGYALSTSVPTITLQTFAYIGDVEIKVGATYQWYRHNNTDWVAISGATNDYFNVSRDDVAFSNNYQCKMQFGGTEYVGVVTIEDKNDENKIFASKPSNYFSGDLWIVGTDYVPSGFAVGTMLRAEHTNSTYADSDWVSATKYDDDINSLKETVDEYKQYFSVNSANGLQIGNSSINNDVLTIETINATSVNSDSASFESLDVVGRYSGGTMLQAPVINLGNFSLVIESNGSLSVVANT